MKRQVTLFVGTAAVLGVLAGAAAGSDAGHSVWLAPERTPAAPWADGVLRSASTAEDLIKQEASRPPAAEDWAAARVKSSNVKEWSGWLAQRRQLLALWMAAQAEHSALVGGYIHDYIDPNTGVRLVWTTATPKPPPGADGSTVQRLERAWVAFMREYNIARIADAARLYVLTGHEEYAVWAASQLDLYASNYGRWPLRTASGRGRMFAHGLDEATNVFALLDAARLLETYAGAQRAIKWREDLFYPIAQNLKTITSPLTNIGLWQSAAIAAVAMRYGDGSLLDYARTSPFGITETLRQGVTRDNLWVEGSFSYNAYVLDVLDKLLTAAAVEGKAAAFTQEALLARRLLLAPLDYRFEDGTLPTPGDGTMGFPARPSWLYAKLYRSVPTWFGLKQAMDVRSWETLLDPPTAQVGAVAPLPPVMSRHFPSNRMAVLKAGPWQAFIRYGQVVQNHAHADALTYELADGLTKISSGVGTVSYAAPQHGEYFTQAAAHNVPLIDGLGQSQLPAAAEVTLFTADENKLTTSSPHYRPDALVERGWRVTNSGFSERTKISLSEGSSALRQLGSAFHTSCNVSDILLQKSGSTVRPPRTKATAFWAEGQEYYGGRQWSVLLDCLGGKKYVLSVSGTREQRVIIAVAPSTPLPTKRTVIYFDAAAMSFEYELCIERLIAPGV